jgi:hypothetical protein
VCRAFKEYAANRVLRVQLDFKELREFRDQLVF